MSDPHSCLLQLHLVTGAVQPALEQLAFQNVGCSINACSSLAELLQNAQELRSLRLYNNMSDDAGAAAIAKVGYPILHMQLDQHWHTCTVWIGAALTLVFRIACFDCSCIAQRVHSRDAIRRDMQVTPTLSIPPK